MGLVLRRVVDPETLRQVCLYRSRARSITPAAEGFAEFLDAWLRDWSRAARVSSPAEPG